MKKSLVVSKFGGTSMGDAPCMLRSADVANKQNACIVVVSATSGTTNNLIALGKAAESGSWESAQAIIEKIILKHQQVAKELSVSSATLEQLENLLQEMSSMAKGINLLKDCSLKAMDSLMSFGERLSSILFVEAMKTSIKKSGKSHQVKWLDVRDVLKTDAHFGKAVPLTETIIQLCQEKLADCKSKDVVYVTQGFIGQSLSGHTTTLGRGGSDYSAAILAEGIGADTLEIWTDVAGIATTDPRIVPQAKPIDSISFTEASELATFGAKVLHPATLLPAVRQRIPVFVGSSFDADQKGTWVQLEVKDQPLVRAMALRRQQTLVTLTTPEMLNSHGFLLRIFKVFNDHKISVDSITTSEISVAMTFDNATWSNKTLLQDLSQIADVQVEENLSLVSLIGNNINHTAGLAKQIFDSIPEINVRMICLGASKHNFCFLVADDQANEALKKLHKTFCEA